MPHGFRLTPLAALALTGLLAACSADPGPDADSSPTPQASSAAASTPQPPQLQAWTPASASRAESWLLLDHDQRLAADAEGIWLLDADGQQQARHPGNFYTLDARRHGERLLIASTHTASQQPTLLVADAANLRVHQQLVLPASDYRIENLCLYQDESANLHLFIIGEEGMGDQWLVASPDGLLNNAAHVRTLRLPPESEHCAVDDQQHLLYVSEELSASGPTVPTLRRNRVASRWTWSRPLASCRRWSPGWRWFPVACWHWTPTPASCMPIS